MTGHQETENYCSSWWGTGRDGYGGGAPQSFMMLDVVTHSVALLKQLHLVLMKIFNKVFFWLLFLRYFFKFMRLPQAFQCFIS